MRFCIRHRPFDSAYLLYVVITLQHSHCLHSPFLKTIIPNYLPKSEFPFRISALEWKRAYHPSKPPCATIHPFIAQHRIVCYAREHLLLRNKISTPAKTPNLQISK